MKNLQEKPFTKFINEHKVGDVIKGKIATLTDFGAFVSIGNVDGLLHNEEASWETNAKCKNLFKKGDEVEVKIIKIDREKENKTKKVNMKRRDSGVKLLHSHAALLDVVIVALPLNHEHHSR